MALMDAGVPIKAPVSGIAMGLITDAEKGISGGYAILSDIQGLEDHIGDMDFKVAGTRKGITALQMDIKIDGLTPKVLEEALAQANGGRLAILERMLETISAPGDLKAHTPRITTVHIDPEKIGALIGPGGKNVRGIQEQTGVKIDIQEDGTVYIASNDGPSAERAKEMVMGLGGSVELGTVYTGPVTRITDFGCFVEIMPKLEGMVHVSQLADFRVERVEDEVKLGQEITVMVIGTDNGKVRLSRKAVLAGLSLEEAQASDRGSRPSGGGRDRDRGPRRDGDRGGRDRDRGPRRDGDRGDRRPLRRSDDRGSRD
jgi:polyribonucleotide nucleotidyltransferase